MTTSNLLVAGITTRNPVWIQMLGLCPLLAVSTSVATALGLAMASALVLLGSNTLIAALRRWLPDFARLPAFMLLIAGFTTLAVLLMEAWAFDLYTRIALFVQIIVTNCMILGRAEQFASRNAIGAAVLDALGTAIGFAIALVALGAVREVIGRGTLFAGMDGLFGASAASLAVTVLPNDYRLLLAALPPGAFIVAGLMLALARALTARTSQNAGSPR
ncbi:MAG: electron transport complex subunit RsxE [Pseudomonadales bacterium]|nr:electron transport complex subunit RsxE [Pseudomonadales bacterium]MCP5182405.1 electron transport complex subunit RsxE [Pseudomonadales bacterium]